MADQQAIAAALPRLKVLALPKGVLLPGSGLPLQLGEPGPLALVEEAMQGDQVIAVAMLARGWEAAPGARPPMRAVAGAGVIEEHQMLAGGGREILVRGVARVRIVGEHSAGKPFREVSAVAVEESPAQDNRQVETVRRAVLQLSGTLPEDLGRVVSIAAARIVDPGTLCDAVAAALFEDVEALQAVLEAFEVQSRLQRVLSEVGALLLASQPPSSDLLS